MISESHLLDLLKEIKEQINALYQPISPNGDQSASVKNIYEALAKAQGEYKPLIPNQRATESDKLYANLADIMAATRDALSKNSLMFSQSLKLLDEGSGASILITKIGHSSGEWISSSTRVVAGKTDYASGYTLEMHKRLQALMLLGIAPSSNDPFAHDDNGDEQVGKRKAEELVKGKKEKDVDRTIPISKDRYEILKKELDLFTYPDDADHVLKGVLSTHSLSTLSDLPDDLFSEVYGNIRTVRIRIENANKK